MAGNTIKKRLFIISSTFTVAVAAALVKQLGDGVENYLVSIAPLIYENVDEHIRREVEQLGVFKDVKFYFDFCKPKKNFKEEKSHILSFNVKKFKESISNVEFDEIYSVYIHGAANHLFNQYPKADLYFIEDGTATYLKMDNAEIINKRAKKIYTLNYFDKIIPYITTYEKVPTEQIDKYILRDVFEVLSKNIKFNLEKKEKTIVFCAQNISISQVAMTYQDELMLYVKYIKKLLNMGYFVYFKDHPKTPNMFYKNLVQFIKHPNFDTVGAYSVLPMETLVLFLKPCAIVSMFSSALLSIPWLYGIPSFTFLSDKDFKDHKIFGIAHMLVANYIPSIEFIHENVDVTNKNFQLFVDETLSLPELVYYRIKNIDFFKFFISRREYYSLQKKLKTSNNLILRFFKLDSEVLLLFKSQSYWKYLSYYRKYFYNYYLSYKKEKEKQIKKSKRVIIDIFNDIMNVIFKVFF